MNKRQHSQQVTAAMLAKRHALQALDAAVTSGLIDPVLRGTTARGYDRRHEHRGHAKAIATVVAQNASAKAICDRMLLPIKPSRLAVRAGPKKSIEELAFECGLPYIDGRVG